MMSATSPLELDAGARELAADLAGYLRRRLAAFEREDAASARPEVVPLDGVVSAYRDACGRWCTEARRKLNRDPRSSGDLALLVRVVPQTIRQLRGGAITPSLAVAVVLEDVCGIAPRDWRRAPDPNGEQNASPTGAADSATRLEVRV
jgi:hypothetical protein